MVGVYFISSLKHKSENEKSRLEQATFVEKIFNYLWSANQTPNMLAISLTPRMKNQNANGPPDKLPSATIHSF